MLQDLGFRLLAKGQGRFAAMASIGVPSVMCVHIGCDGHYAAGFAVCMYVCVCMSVCMYVCMCLYVRRHACNVCMHGCMYVCMYM